MSDFLDKVLESTRYYECPSRFYYFAALSAVSAILKDNVFFDMGGAYTLYPNIYCLLYGPSGVRKGPAIALAEQIVKKVDSTRVINGRASIEAIIKELGTFKTREKKEPLKDACGFIVASELASSIIGNTSALDIMTNLYDRIYNTDKWEYKLKVGESHTLNKPTITWLSASNEALLKDFMPEKNIHGGLIGRIFMISENKPNTINSLMFRPKAVPNYEELAEMVRPLTKLKGQFIISNELRNEIDEWYNKFMKDISPTLRDETGFVSRVLDYVMKNSMLISSARRGDMIITEEDIKESMTITLPLILPTKKASNALRKNDPTAGEKRGLILTYITRQKGFCCSRTNLLKDLSLRIDHEDLDRVVNLLLAMEVVKIENHGSEIIYKLKMDNPKVSEWIAKEYGA